MSESVPSAPPRKLIGFSFYSTGFENSDEPCLVVDDPQGGDPHILARLTRIYRSDAIYDLVRLANWADQYLLDAPSAASSHAVFFDALGRKGARTLLALTDTQAEVDEPEADKIVTAMAVAYCDALAQFGNLPWSTYGPIRAHQTVTAMRAAYEAGLAALRPSPSAEGEGR